MATGRSNTALGLSPSGEATASGAKFLLDENIVIYREVIVDSASTDSLRLPTTTLEPGLVLIKQGTGRWKSLADASIVSTDNACILHNNNEPVNVLDSLGTAQHRYGIKVVVHGLVIPANVHDSAGVAISTNGKAALTDSKNGCNVMFAAS